MGGLTAFLTQCQVSSEGVRPSNGNLNQALEQSLDIIKHRGPDAKGQWISDDGHVGFGHVRLSVIDPGPGGNQPFHDATGDIHSIVHGELYGHERYRESLSNEFDFKGHSDCEIVIALYKHYGLSFLSHLRGEFALILWDAKKELFFAARDRYGAKSLYYTIENGQLLVATEMKSFLAFGWQPEWCVRGLQEQAWLYSSGTLFKGVHKVKAGHYLTSRHFGPVEQGQYWDVDYPDKVRLAEDPIRRGQHVQTILETRTEEEMIAGVRERLLESVRVRLRADAPIGLFLSGGIDSSAIAGIIAHLVQQEGISLGNDNTGDVSRIECFTVQFDKDSGVDESDVAQRTAEWLGVRLNLVQMDEEALAEGLEDVVWHSETPCGDVNGVGRLAMAEMAHSKGLKVVLTGEGSDEHFAGYPDYRADSLQEPDLSWPPSCFPKQKEIWKSITTHEDSNTLIPGLRGSSDSPESTRRMLNFIRFPIRISAVGRLPYAPWTNGYRSITSETALAESLSLRALDAIASKWHPLHASMYVSLKTFAQNLILRYVGDNVDTAHHIESRMPFYDHRLTEYVNSIPPSLKMKYELREKDFREKHILREAVKPFITEEIYNRRKKPFMGPNRFSEDGPIHRVLKRLLTWENVDQLGFIDWDQVSILLNKAFKEKNSLAFMASLNVAQFVVLSRRFKVPKAQPINAM